MNKRLTSVCRNYDAHYTRLQKIAGTRNQHNSIQKPSVYGLSPRDIKEHRNMRAKVFVNNVNNKNNQLNQENQKMYDRLQSIHSGKSPLSKSAIRHGFHPGAPGKTFKREQAYKIDEEN